MEEIFLPAMGMAMESATLVEWLKEEGEGVAAGEEVALVESDKSTVGLTAPAAGRLGRHLFAVGDAVPAGATVARILGRREREEDERVQERPGEAAGGTEQGVAAANSAQAGAAGAAPARPPAAVPGGRQHHRLSPRRRYRRHLAAVDQAAAQARAARAPAGAPLGETLDERRRAVIAGHVTESWREIPHFGVSRVIAADPLPEALRRLRRRQPDLTVTDFFLAAIARLLRAAGQAADAGLAVATRAGVALTVLRGLEDTPEANTSARELAVEQVRSLRGGSDKGPPPVLTLSNIGALGVSWFTGIIPSGQQALLTTGSVLEQPVVRSGKIVVGASFTAVLNADHRMLDGVDAARLLRDFDRQLQDVLQEVDE